MKKRKSKRNSPRNIGKEDPLKVMINGKEETIYGTEKEAPKKNQEKKLTFSNWEEKRKAEQEVSASKENSKPETDDEFTWAPPDEEEDVFQDDPKVVAPYKKKNEGKVYQKAKKSFSYPFKRFAVTIIFAVLLGTGLGVFALNLASNQEEVPASASLGADEGGGKTAKAGDTTGSDGGEKAVSEAGADLKAFAVQAGKFSSKEGAETLASQIVEKGYAAVPLAKDDGYYVIAGIAGEKQMTSQLGQILIDHDFEAWGGKELSFSLDSGLSPAFKEAAELSAKAILGAEVTEKNIADLKAEIDGIQPEGDSKKVKEGILKAVDLLEKPTATNGWKSQQLLLSQIK
ncbi:SPOR domain-containing protein [Bacillus sonorensis]|uniref:SPOR domain-containing protein n=1 Tax=Bacillus sonorensis TaxID=119858 RepID=UPI000496CBC0|nr:SPOR domain-containing protein [Bacillus sonorensis]MEC1354890.1 SPOR domain-containing protein [Bacillus sonorensis]MEC1427092.1 SPOR domain-containing protein [Bacillus sonorensis]MEC1439434.1 SPOR domain-containing protein [Bacillus sonorensis]MEC1590767.1 SPOR domain-containing protein [Bacillus sonorensis]